MELAFGIIGLLVALGASILPMVAIWYYLSNRDWHFAAFLALWFNIVALRI